MVVSRSMKFNNKIANLNVFRPCRTAAALIGVIALFGAAAADAERNVTGTPTEIVLQQVIQGNYTSAAQHLRQALEVTPDDAMLNDIVGAVALNTGDTHTARTAFQ